MDSVIQPLINWDQSLSWKKGRLISGVGTLACTKAAADDRGDALLGSTKTADLEGTDKELELGSVSELLVVDFLE